MDPVDVVRHSLFALHMLGLAGLVGGFFVQIRRTSDFVLWPLLTGAIVQVVTGVAMVGIAEARGRDVDMTWVAVKGVIALVVLIAAIGAVIAQRRGARVQPWFHAAGGLATINVLVATLWP